MGMVLFLIVCLIAIVVLQLGFIFLLLALMPSVVAFYTDTDRKRSIFKVIGSTNLAATLPTLVPMLKNSFNMRHYDMESVFTSPTVWLFIYSGAAAGWGLIYVCRYISHFIVSMSYEYNINNLKRQQKRLTEEWGDEIMQSESGEGLPAEAE